jgi:hypothetical protein
VLYNELINDTEVMIMLFRKKIQKSCEYCTNGTILDNDQILCAKRGLTDNVEKCRKFRYDPIKRVPCKPKAIDFSQYDDQDFSL